MSPLDNTPKTPQEQVQSMSDADLQTAYNLLEGLDDLDSEEWVIFFEASAEITRRRRQVAPSEHLTWFDHDALPAGAVGICPSGRSADVKPFGKRVKIEVASALGQRVPLNLSPGDAEILAHHLMRSAEAAREHEG